MTEITANPINVQNIASSSTLNDRLSQAAWHLKQALKCILRPAGANYRTLLADAEKKGALSSVVPQGSLLDSVLTQPVAADWRKHFASQLSGRGLEIGPLHRPLVKHDGMKMEYVDRLTLDQLRSHYPELASLPLVEPDIIADAEDLAPVADCTYDFLVSAHVIEHMKNPIFSLRNWIRVLKPGGLLYLIVPDKRQTFDLLRPRTTLEHIILDYMRPSHERDLEHALEYGVFVHKKFGSESIPEMDNIVNTGYSIHYHVFIPEDVDRLLKWFSDNVAKIEILEGPVGAPGSDEFHFLIKKG